MSKFVRQGNEQFNPRLYNNEINGAGMKSACQSLGPQAKMSGGSQPTGKETYGVKDVNSNDAQLFAGSYAPVKTSKLNQCGAGKKHQMTKKSRKSKKAKKNKKTRSKKQKGGKEDFGTYKDGSSVFKDKNGYYIDEWDNDKQVIYKKYLKSWKPVISDTRLILDKKTKKWKIVKSKKTKTMKKSSKKKKTTKKRKATKKKKTTKKRKVTKKKTPKSKTPKRKSLVTKFRNAFGMKGGNIQGYNAGYTPNFKGIAPNNSALANPQSITKTDSCTAPNSYNHFTRVSK